MKVYTVFYAGLLYGEYAGGEWSGVGITIPDGAYLLYKGELWYVRLAGSFTPINLGDVPPELRTYLLLMT